MPEPVVPEAPVSKPRSDRRRRLWPWILLALVVVLWAESLLPPRHQPTARALVAGIHLYQALLSPRLEASGVQCRFQPSCSRYGEAAIRRFGTLRGGGLTALRLLRCGPWTPLGTVDPSPERR